MEMDDYMAAAEAILFAVGDAVPVSDLAQALEISEKDAESVIENLKKKYSSRDCGIEIMDLEDSIQLCTKSSAYEYLIRIAKQPKKYTLSDVVLETLSIIAYRQPVTRMEIEKIRGVSCSHAINKLLDYGLIRELGRLDAPGKPILFGTTEEFLRCFSVSSTDDLPQLPEDKLEEFKEEASKEAQIELDV